MDVNVPELATCRVCNFKADCIAAHLAHQRIHEGTFNFSFTCPLLLCPSTFRTYAALSSHISSHRIERCEMSVNIGIKCSMCDLEAACNKSLCNHVLNDHIKKGEAALCPLQSVCKSERLFTTVLQLRPHLSTSHPGWTQDFSRTHGTNAQVVIEDSNEYYFDGAASCDDGHKSNGSLEDNSDCDSEAELQLNDSHMENCGYSDKLIIDYIAKFYARLEGQLFVPTSTVQSISESITFLSKIFHARLKEVLTSKLKEASVEKSKISEILQSVLSKDLLYTTHHKTAGGVSFTSDHLRKKYYKENFLFVPPVEINLKKNPQDRTACIQYIPIKDTLKVMLDDPSVQKEVDLSFDVSSVPHIIRNYTDGTVFKKRDPPKRRIDILLFQDAVTVSNPLGSAKKKHKILGVYMTLGNFRPHLRSRLKAKRLVLLANENITREKNLINGLKKSFKRCMADFKDLEDIGIWYRNELLPVRLQFVLGDNLGQHTVGGFLESFSSDYFCRFCTITRSMFMEVGKQARPLFLCAKQRNPKHHARALQKKGDNYSYKGIKRDSIFNSLTHFKVCDPGLPSCLGHDLFIGGVVDKDMALMINHFIGKKWFDRDLLNRRIAAFVCKETDRGNKPAPVHDGGKKLGGHAVQNWTLLRLFPLIIGDKVTDPTDDVWKLYLLLKSICELMCAPALTVDQISKMRLLADEYSVERRCLTSKYRPKDHFFKHIADEYEQCGPLIHLWTLGFEHYHQFFKKVAKVSNNFINILFTMASKHTLKQAYQSTGILFQENAVHNGTFSLVLTSYCDSMQDFMKSCNFSPNAIVIKTLTYSELVYKADKFLLLGAVPDDEKALFVGKVELIIYDNDDHKLVLKKFRAKLWEDFGIYKVKKRHHELVLLSLSDDIENPCPHAVYEFQEKTCLSLKHVPLQPPL